MTNYCTKCGSYYAQPGTCNCFAPTQAAKITGVGPTWIGGLPSSPNATGGVGGSPFRPIIGERP